ncbi:MAG: primosomal protein N' [Thermodesulfobacteriota bacterium]
MSYADVALSVSVDKSFTYAVPEALKGEVEPGRRVLVPFGKRVLTGYVIALAETPAVDKVRDIIDVLDAAPLFDAGGLRFLKWMSSYYLVPLGQVLGLIHPPGADIKGRRVFTLTPEGRAGGSSEKGLAGEILGFLGESGKEVPLTVLLKSFKGRAIYSVLSVLAAKGFIHEGLKLTGGGKGRRERLIAPVSCSDVGAPEAPGPSRPAQKRLYEFLVENGETLLGELNKTFSNAAATVRRLEEKGLVTVSEQRVSPDPMGRVTGRVARHDPNKEQKAAIKALIKVLGKKVFSPFLLYGVTGSGKTLVYLEVLEEVIRRGGRALLLVPEIGLTSWAAEYLKDRFGGLVAIYHSGLTSAERCGQWRRIQSNEARLIVGARSSLFAPITDLSIIIVDEEHDPSYKQEDGVRYNGRDAALMLGKFLKIPVVLGSATPQVESFYNSSAGRFTMLRLEKRVEDRPLPDVEIVDMKGNKGRIISERLKDLLDETFRGGHQALLFLNRRGFSGCLICRDCGYSFTCENCSVTLTFHKGRKRLRCHYCGYSTAVADACPLCNGINLRDPGMGTEKVEEEVQRLFPEKKILRMDSDTTRKKGALKAMMGAMERGEADVLIGTQMVSKGHHYPGITLVGIISGDTSLNIPDFRSPERTFQLVTQAAGRGGRGEAPGRVVIQTLNSSHYALKRAACHDYDGFYAEEIEVRRELSYPPFSRLALIRIEGPAERAVLKASSTLQGVAESLLPAYGKDITCLGPAPALVARVKGEYRFHMLLKGARPGRLHDFVAELTRGYGEKFASSSTRLVVEMDPVNIL